ncbi:MAG: hypothetical protein WC819_00905 [Parcubacteria group bacterium]|jgi:hypothetical protein
MENINEESGRIASLALFKELYDSEKDVYGVLSCFLQEIIITEAKYSFTLQEITYLLNDTFNFHIPEAVVKTSLGRLKEFLNKDQGKYFANLSNIKSPSLIPKKDEITKGNNEIIEQIVDFISSQKKQEINETDKKEIMHSFCSFLLDKSNNQKYSEYISAFIISKSPNPDFINRLQSIKEGVVLYTGIMFSDNIGNVGSWNTKLTIFLDTEILFDFAGFNGELFKSLFDEFHSFVKEINQKASEPLIKLRYFLKTEENIHNYFSKAEYIISGGEVVDPGRPAMNNILNGSKSKSDVVEKKTIFFDLLNKNDIHADDYLNYYEKENHKYNITFHKAEENIEQSIAASIGVNEIKDNLELLNFVSIKRADEYNNNFEHIKYILLSGNNTTLQVAWHKSIRKSGEVPLATSLHFLTDKFWFKLNKGFGTNTFPKIFDVITKAQILLSSQLNKSVGNKFDELQKRFKNGKLNDNQVALAITNLRKQAKKPEDIMNDNISFILESLAENNLDKIIEEQEHFKNKAKKHEEENTQLKKEVESINLLLDNQIKKQGDTEKKLITETMKIKMELLSEKRNNFSYLEDAKNKFDKKINKQIYLRYKLTPVFLLLIYFIGWVYIISKFGWNKIEPLTYIMGLIPLLVIYAVSIWQEKTFNPIQYICIQKEKCKIKLYSKEKFDFKLYEKLQAEITKIENEISDMQKL